MLMPGGDADDQNAPKGRRRRHSEKLTVFLESPVCPVMLPSSRLFAPKL